MDITLESCRICLEKLNLKSIFEKGYDIPIWEKIVYCASVQISEDDYLPNLICNQCLIYLDIAYAFKTMCEDTDKKLRNLQLTKEIGEFDDTECEQEGQSPPCDELEENSGLLNMNTRDIKYHGESKCCVKEVISNILTKNVFENLTSDDINTEHVIDEYNKEGIVTGNYLKPTSEEKVSKFLHHKINGSTKIHEDVVNTAVSKEVTTNYQTEKQYPFKDGYFDSNSKIQNNNNSQVLKINNESMERKNTLEHTKQVLEKNVLKSGLIDKVGRHIAKKITGKFPQKLHNSNSLNNDSHKNSEIKLKEKVMLNDVNLDVQNFEDILENEVPAVGFEETVVTDNESFPYKINNNVGQGLKGSASLVCAKIATKSKGVDKKSHVKIKMNTLTLRRGNRKINVFDERYITSVKIKEKNKLKNQTKNEIKKLSSRKTKDRFKCDVCCRAFPFRSHLIRHLNMHTGIKRYACEYCEQKFVNSYNLGVHMLKHTGQYPLKCELCDKGFPNPSLLKRHKASHTGETNFQCRYCSVKFTQSSSLRLHEKMHLHRPSYHCDICYKVFSYTNSLAAHRKLHFGSRRYTCDTCLVTFSRKSSLIRHMEGHYKSKRIKCKFCDISFNTKSNYYSHLKTHCKYKCDICDQGFQSKANLVNHVKFHKNGLKCEQCYKEFQTKTHLIKHLQKHIR